MEKYGERYIERKRDTDIERWTERGGRDRDRETERKRERCLCRYSRSRTTFGPH